MSASTANGAATPSQGSVSSQASSSSQDQGAHPDVDFSRQVIRNRQLIADDWRYIDEDPAGSHLALIFPFARWQAERDRWWLWAGRLGVRIAPTDKIQSLAPDLKRLALVAVEFPNPGDGRGYSHARLLRERHGFTGELRATGYVKRDQIFFMARCGINVFEVADGVDPVGLIAAFDNYDVAYQGAVDQNLHLKRRA